MKCPVCNSTTAIEIDIHADGYAKDLFECTICEALWLSDVKGIALITKRAA